MDTNELPKTTGSLELLPSGGCAAEKSDEKAPDNAASIIREEVENDHAVAANSALEYSAVQESGHMDHHRKPIVSIHGKDVDEHELDHKSAA